MRAPSIEVRDVFGKCPTQVTLAEDECVVQALLPDRSHPSLGDRIGFGRPKWRAGLDDPKALQPSVEESAIAAIAVANQIAWWLTIPTAAFHDLLRRPLRGRIFGHLCIHHLACRVAYHEEDIERLEENRLHVDEVAGPDFASMLLEEFPPPGRWSPTMRPTHVLGDGSRRDFEPQPHQLRLDPTLAP